MTQYRFVPVMMPVEGSSMTRVFEPESDKIQAVVEYSTGS